MSYLQRAIDYARRDDRCQYLFAAIAVRKDGAIVKSRNIPNIDKCSSAHAEARVIKKAGHAVNMVDAPGF